MTGNDFAFVNPTKNICKMCVHLFRPQSSKSIWCLQLCAATIVVGCHKNQRYDEIHLRIIWSESISWELVDINKLIRIYVMIIIWCLQMCCSLLTQTPEIWWELFDKAAWWCLMFQMCAAAIMVGCHKLQRYDANPSKSSSRDGNRWKEI